MESLGAQKADFYYNSQDLEKIKTKGRTHSKEAIEDVARQFETLFVDMMVSSMRGAGKVFEEGSMLSNSTTDFYQGMYDKQLSQELVKNKGFGLAATLSKQLYRQYESELRASSPPSEIGKLPADFNQRLKKAEQMMEESMRAKSNDKSTTQNTPPLTSSVLSSSERSASTLHANLKMQANYAISPLTKPKEKQIGNLGDEFASPEDFMEKLTPIAQKIGLETDMDPALLMAQAALETGWGKHMINNEKGESSFNLFGIKATKEWAGKSVSAQTTEFVHAVPVKEQANFRVYSSYEESFRDYVDVLRNNTRYKEALNADHPHEFAQNLQKAGYATDPQYSQKIMSIYKKINQVE